MKVSEALQIIRQARGREDVSASLGLACGFEPLHLATLLTAHLQALTPDRRVDLGTGLFGDLVGNVERLGARGGEGLVVVWEWFDLDRRLGLRDLGGWRPADLVDVVAHARAASARLQSAIAAAAARLPVAVCGPTLPLPPASRTPGWLQGTHTAELHAIAAALTAALARADGVRVVDQQRLAMLSPLSDRLDVKASFATGFPYRVTHASIVAELLARLMRPLTPKKGLITDLDDTLWRGILGEDGGAGVSWDLDRKSHAHGLYQQLLASLADAGVLIAVASKADSGVVEAGLASSDLLMPGARFFPVEAHWEPKSFSVARILRAWNVGADSVVVVDDSPAELAEVEAVHPGITCLQFPTGDDEATYALLERLRDLLGTAQLSAEDAIRAESLRRAAVVPDALTGSTERQDVFLASAEQELSVLPVTPVGDARPLELVNKTNQFNLNGRRYTEGEWRALLERRGTVAIVLSYRDKYGPLGKISVLAGHLDGDALTIDTWVLSCRAFSRRVEWGALDVVFERFGLRELCFQYGRTPKNHLVKEFLARLTGTEPAADGPVRASRDAFRRSCPALFFRYLAGAAA